MEPGNTNRWVSYGEICRVNLFEMTPYHSQKTVELLHTVIMAKNVVGTFLKRHYCSCKYTSGVTRKGFIYIL